MEGQFPRRCLRVPIYLCVQLNEKRTSPIPDGMVTSHPLGNTRGQGSPPVGRRKSGRIAPLGGSQKMSIRTSEKSKKFLLKAPYDRRFLPQIEMAKSGGAGRVVAP